MGKSSELALDQLPAPLHKIALAMQPLYRATPAAIRKIVLEAGVRPEDLQAWADFDHPASDSYGRKLAYKGDHFEIMVMSWRPGDASAIHDHGFTQWGAVQVFGPGEHATFRIEEGVMHTASRGVLQPGQVIAVSHDLMHQMINPTTDEPFFSLHVYGLDHEIDNVTGEARVFDVVNGQVQRVDGGVFYALPPEGIKYIDEGPRGDFPTRLRHLVELARRMKKFGHPDLPRIADLIFSGEQREELFSFLQEILDENLHQTDSTAWCVINREMKEAGRFQDEWLKDLRGADPFHQYAEWYDALVGKPCLDGFMANYLRFFLDHYGVALSKSSILSLGCGTGLTEEFLIRELGVPYANLEGIDVSDAMLEVARRRIQARKEDIFDLGPWARRKGYRLQRAECFSIPRPPSAGRGDSPHRLRGSARRIFSGRFYHPRPYSLVSQRGMVARPDDDIPSQSPVDRRGRAYFPAERDHQYSLSGREDAGFVRRQASAFSASHAPGEGLF
ncbi:MAG: methyltransferase domain-containing protein [Saprospirales bacterium]|nr:methyltransferase domain-containing protein [Saprospirales bacterium]